MLSIAITYFITLCLFPGLESEIRNPTFGEWLPILIMAVFNMADFVGKVRQLQKEELSYLYTCTSPLYVYRQANIHLHTTKEKKRPYNIKYVEMNKT